MARHSFPHRLASRASLVAVLALISGSLLAAPPETSNAPKSAPAPAPASAASAGVVKAALPAAPPPSLAAPAEALHLQIDRLVAAKTPKYESLQAPLSSDSEFLRRITLDLTGTIPSTNSARGFLANQDSEKRVKLIDSLLASPEHSRHFAEVFDVILMRRINSEQVPSTEWMDYLRESFAENKPYDQLIREILSADGADQKTHCRSRFYVDRQGEMNEITRDVGRLFLGADLECAQCHDHPQIDDFRQEHYYGLAAFFIRASVYKAKDRQFMIAEKADGEVSFESVLDIRDKVSTGPKTTKPRLFDNPEMAEPVLAKGDSGYLVKPGRDVRPVPKYSRLGAIAQVITSSENTRFARTTANRLWSVMMGRGIIEPVDLDHSFNPPSNPELLDALTKAIVRQKYNVRQFVREIALSRTYQLSSQRLKADGSAAENAPPEAFAQSPIRPLSPEQMARALLQGTGEVDAPQSAPGKPAKVAKPGETRRKRPTDYLGQIVSMFGGVPGKPSPKFEASPMQALFLSNDPLIVSLTELHSGNLTDRLSRIAPTDSQKIADELCISLLTRPASEQDVSDVREYLTDCKPEERPKALRDLIWALATSSEFRFNH